MPSRMRSGSQRRPRSRVPSSARKVNSLPGISPVLSAPRRAWPRWRSLRRAGGLRQARRRRREASPSRGPGNGILWAETGGRFQAQNAGERSEFGSQTATRLTNRPKLRGFLSTRKPRRFVGTAWWRTQSRQTGLRDRVRLGNREKHTAMASNVFLGGPKRGLLALFVALKHSSSPFAVIRFFRSGLRPVSYSKEGLKRESDQ